MQYSALLFLLLSLLPKIAFAQTGVSFYYGHQMKSEWVLENKTSLDPALGVGFNAHFRLKNYRIEFFPEAFALQSGNFEFYQEPGFEPNYIYFGGQLTVVGLKAPTRFYFFDFEGDCNCPTWSKQGSFFKKGFFLQIFPQAGWLLKRLQWGDTFSETKPNQLITNKKRDFFFGGGGGIGLDIGLSKNFTLTPMVNFDWISKTEWSMIHCRACDILPQESTLSNLTFGMNLSFAWKE